MHRVFYSVDRSFILGAIVMVSIATLRAQQPPPSPLPDGEGKEIVAVACTQCHGLTPILQMRDGAAGWKEYVEEMVLRGAQLSPAEAETVTGYLARNFGPSARASDRVMVTIAPFEAA